MARPERAVDPAGGEVAGFAVALRTLRHEAGLTYRQLAATSGYSASTLAEAAAGRRLPSLDVAVAFAVACGGEPEAWTARWQSASALLAGDGGPSHDSRIPYRGLAGFRGEDTALFFGRDRVVDDVVAAVQRWNIAVVVGASGAGKTSLLHAGVVPALMREAPGLHVESGTPTRWSAQDLDGLAHAPHRLVVLDQFEELFTQHPDAREQRARFVDAVLRLAEHASVIVAVRADFYGHCLRYPGLAEVLRERQVPVGPLREDELREAITRPAAAVGLSVERALVATAVRDALGHPVRCR